MRTAAAAAAGLAPQRAQRGPRNTNAPASWPGRPRSAVAISVWDVRRRARWVREFRCFHGSIPARSRGGYLRLEGDRILPVEILDDVTVVAAERGDAVAHVRRDLGDRAPGMQLGARAPVTEVVRAAEVEACAVDGGFEDLFAPPA